MDPTSLVVDLGLVAAQAVVLYLVSQRLLLGYVVSAIAARSRGRFGRVVVNLLRLPGNLLHELSHAVGYLAGGFTIRRLSTCASDPEGRGYCEPGRRWSPLGWMPLAAAVAAILPLFAGALALRELGSRLGVPLPAADVTGEGVSPVVAHLIARVPSFLAHLNWASGKTYLFWYLALSIGAELAPSDVDARRGGPVVLLFCALLVLGVYAVPHMEMQPEIGRAFYRGLRWLLGVLSQALFAGLVGSALVGAAAGLAVWVLGGRGGR